MNNLKNKRPCSPKESLDQSLQEMKKMRNGKLEKITWDQYKNKKGK
ncbi:MAG: hypothetical protein ACOCV1_06970 [Bacillota bacterium]